jgi:hypothetical protein
MITHRLTQTWGAGSSLIGTDVNVTADSEQNVSAVIPDAAANQNLSLAWPAGKLRSLVIVVSKDCDLYVNAPSGGSPTDHLELKAGVPLVWMEDSGARSPIIGTAGAVSAVYVSVPTTDPVADCTFNLRAAVDL